MARRGNAAASGFSGQRLHDVRADDRQRRADHIAHEGHQDADGNERTGVGAGEDRRGGRAADVGERGHARGEEVELEELADDEHQHRADAEDNEAGGDPGGSLTELEQARAGGQQADDGVEQEAGDLAGAGDLAERGDGGDQGDDGDEQNGSGRFIGEVGQRIELVADVGGDGADKERGAEQEDQTLEGDGLGLGHIPHAQRAQEHGDEVAENDRRNVLEEFLHAALGAFLQRDENGCHKEQHRHM